MAAEISASISEEGFRYLKVPIKRITLPDIPAPASSVLEKAYYPSIGDIVSAAKKMMQKSA